MGAAPQQGSIAPESRSLAHADCNERGRATGEDHFAHAPGRICKACGRTIEPGQDARRTGEADWAHDVCPPLPPASADRSHACAPARPRRLPPRLSTAQSPRPSVTTLLLSPTGQGALCRRPSADLAFSKQYIVRIRRVRHSATLCNRPSPRARAPLPLIWAACRYVAWSTSAAQMWVFGAANARRSTY